MVTTETLIPPPQISVIVPARNEEACLADCLQSLVSQTGVAFEIIVVDDHSTDRTREIATSFPGVRVIDAGPLPDGWTGKNNAVAAGARSAFGASPALSSRAEKIDREANDLRSRGTCFSSPASPPAKWLLFTDADTVHLPGSLAAALKEAEENGAEMLSYSPEQIAVTFWEMATLPVVFAELARQYSPSKVSDPASTIAAANGQYILIRLDTYEAVGGHAAVAADILEDVALARNVKKAGRKILFRYGANAVRTRMYRNYAQLRDGWTKNLALLFPNPGWLALKTLVLWAFPWITLCLRLGGVLNNSSWDVIIGLEVCWLLIRISRANFRWHSTALGAMFGMPMFAYLLLRSKRAHSNRSVRWKGRTYGSGTIGSDTDTMNELVHRSPTVSERLS